MEGCLIRAIRLLALFIAFCFLLVTADCVGGFMLDRYAPGWDERLEDLVSTGSAPAGVPGANGREPHGPSFIANEDELALDHQTRHLIQQGLANDGFDPGTADGQFGPATRAAIRAWQTARGAPATGYLDDVQAELLRSAAAPAPHVTGSEFFTRGSHQDDVLRLQGTPDRITALSDSEIWGYGLSTVTISTESREVTEWWNLEGNLRVRLVPGHLSSGTPRAAEPEPGTIFRPGAGIVNPRLLREVKPQYTAEALRAKIAGTVYLEVVVLADGTVGDVPITESLDPVHGLDEAAVKAARQWLFEPGTRFGDPVAVLVNLALDFNLR